MLRFLFSFRGRIGRRSYWHFLLVVAIILLPVFVVFGAEVEAGDDLIGLVFLVLLWPSLAVQAKRWHDRNKSAWWILINFVPLIGPIWALVELGFLRGTRGPNRFGEDPLVPPERATA